MVFEIVVKNHHGLNFAIKPMQISVRKNGLGLGSELVKFCDGKGFAEVYIDYENNKIGIKPTVNGVTGFKLQKSGSRQPTQYIASQKLADRLQKGLFMAEIEDDMIVMKVPEIAKNE